LAAAARPSPVFAKISMDEPRPAPVFVKTIPGAARFIGSGERDVLAPVEHRD
jgi:hypothetical protein